MTKKKRPLGIKINVAVLLISASLALLGALAIMMLGALTYMNIAIPILSLLGFAAFIIFLIGIAEVILAFGLWNYKTWAWWILVVFGILGFVADIFAMISGTVSVIGMAIGVVLLLGLLHKDTIKAIKPGIDWKGWSA